MPSILRSTACKENCHNRVAILERRWLDSTASSYYMLHRILLLSVGLWPYQSSSSKHIIVPFMTLSLISSVALQLTTFITTEYNVDLLLHVLSYSVPWLSYLLKYSVLCLNTRKMRDVVERVRRDWDELSNAREIEIIKRYTGLGRFITIFTTLFLYMSACGFILIQVLSNYFLDWTSPANESRPWQLPVMVEYFVDKQKYYTPILSHVFFLTLVATTVVAGTETLYMTFAQHTCALFEIANAKLREFCSHLVGFSRRVERALLRMSGRRDVAFLVERRSICGIINAVNLHRRALELIEILETAYRWSYNVQLPLAVSSLSINLYRLSLLITREEYYEMSISFIFVLSHFWYMGFCNYVAQEVVDHSGEIFYRAYNAQWYTASLRAQKLLLTVMQRGMRRYVIVINGLFVASLEGFATLISMSVSYFMMIISVRDR